MRSTGIIASTIYGGTCRQPFCVTNFSLLFESSCFNLSEMCSLNDFKNMAKKALKEKWQFSFWGLLPYSVQVSFASLLVLDEIGQSLNKKMFICF